MIFSDMDIEGKRVDHDSLTEKVIGCAFKVMNALGVGFLERVYENALVIEVNKIGLKLQQQVPIAVFYDDEEVGKYVAGVIVDGKLLLELKVVKQLSESRVAQCLNYLKATGIKTCLLINFGKSKIEVRRISN